MRYNVLTAALIATIALCMTGCVSTRSATSERLQLTAYSLINENENDNENKKVNRFAQSLKWLFLTLVAVIAIIILMKIKLRR